MRVRVRVRVRRRVPPSTVAVPCSIAPAGSAPNSSERSGTTPASAAAGEIQRRFVASSMVALVGLRLRVRLRVRLRLRLRLRLRSAVGN